MKTWPAKCPLVCSFHCLPHTNILHCQMNLLPLLLKLLWLWKQNQKLPEPSKSIKIYCSQTWICLITLSFQRYGLHCYAASGFFLFAWHESPERAAGQQVASPWQLEQHFQLCVHLADASCFRKLFTGLGLPRKPAYLVFTDFGCYHSYNLLVSYSDEEPAVLLAWPRISIPADPQHGGSSSGGNYMAGTNSFLLQPCWLSRSWSAIRMKNCQVPAPKILPAPSSVLQPTLA